MADRAPSLGETVTGRVATSKVPFLITCAGAHIMRARVRILCVRLITTCVVPTTARLRASMIWTLRRPLGRLLRHSRVSCDYKG